MVCHCVGLWVSGVITKPPPVCHAGQWLQASEFNGSRPISAHHTEPTNQSWWLISIWLFRRRWKKKKTWTEMLKQKKLSRRSLCWCQEQQPWPPPRGLVALWSGWLSNDMSCESVSSSLFHLSINHHRVLIQARQHQGSHGQGMASPRRSEQWPSDYLYHNHYVLLLMCGLSFCCDKAFTKAYSSLPLWHSDHLPMLPSYQLKTSLGNLLITRTYFTNQLLYVLILEL